MNNEIEYLTTEEAAHILRIHPERLRYLRNRGEGPPFYRRGDTQKGRVFYRREDIDKWFIRYDQNFEPRGKNESQV